MDIAIPGYEIERELGQGGMARVYLAVQTSFKRHVALKIMRPELASADPVVAERFIREGRYVATMSHPNIIKVFDTGVVNGHYYLSMEYLTGGTLQDRLKRDLSAAKGVEIVKAIARALDYAHQQDIIHRDIKTQNILLYPDDTPVLSDFGLAKATKASNLSVAGQMLGSPCYMSPEQINGEEVDARTDMYALGVVLFEVLAGKPPYDAELPLTVLMMHIQMPIPKLPPATARYQAVVEGLLAKDPQQRIANAEQLLGKLDEAENKAAYVSPASPSPSPSPSAPVPASDEVTVEVDQFREFQPAEKPSPRASQRKKNPLAWLAAAVAGVLVISGVWLLLDKRQAAQEEAAFAAAQQSNSKADYQTYLSICETCTHRAQAETALAEIQRAEQEAADTAMFLQARKAGIQAAFEDYLANCDICAHRAAAEQAIAEQVAAVKRVEQDEAFYAEALQADTAQAYSHYLKTCELCVHRAAAEEALDRLYAPGMVFHDRLQDGSPAPAMVVIPAGEFTLGSPPDEPDREQDEAQYSVAIEQPFALGRYEVSVGEFRAFVTATGYRTDAEKNLENDGCWSFSMERGGWGWNQGHSWENPGFEQDERHPVLCISVNDALAYSEWLSRQTGEQYRLPTEAEWEFAARANAVGMRHWGDDPQQACAYANVADETKTTSGITWNQKHDCEDGYWYTAPVGTYRSNAFGLHDMLGNVWEMTCSEYKKVYDSAVNRCSALDSDTALTVRGGSWGDAPARVRLADRDRGVPWNRTVAVGFRVARAISY